MIFQGEDGDGVESTGSGRRPHWRRLQVMRRFASLVMVLLMLVMASPMAACAASLAMSPSERACCRAMHGQCHETAGYPCCQAHLLGDLSQETASPAHSSQVPVPVTIT